MNPSSYSVISFPGLGIEVDPIRAITIGQFSIHLYGLVIAFGLMLAHSAVCESSISQSRFHMVNFLTLFL